MNTQFTNVSSHKTDWAISRASLLRAVAVHGADLRGRFEAAVLEREVTSVPHDWHAPDDAPVVRPRVASRLLR